MFGTTVLFLCVTLFILGLLHLYWGAGGMRYREFATPRVNGKPTAQPSRLSFIAMALGLWTAGLTVVFRAVDFGGRGLHGTTASWHWIFAGLFAFRAIGDFRLIGFFCRRADASYLEIERKFIAPLCLLLAIGFVRMGLLPVAT